MRRMIIRIKNKELESFESNLFMLLGGYLAVVAASLHLEVSRFFKYSVNNILSLPMFNKIPDEDLGELFLGDNNNRKVYVIGSKTGHLIEKPLKGLQRFMDFIMILLFLLFK